jgi:large repetitive protein
MSLSLWDFIRTLPDSFVSIRRNHHGRPACPSRNNPVPQRLSAASLAGSSVTRRRPTTLYATLIAAVGLVAGASSLPAQVTYTGSQSTLATLPSASSISPIAVDTAGDVFFVTSGSSGNTLYELPQGGTLKVLNSSFPYSPMAIAASPDGKSLYFAHNGAQCTSTSPVYSHVSIASVSSGVPQDMPCSFSFSGYSVAYTDVQGLATDAAGNLYIADFGAGEIDRISSTITASSVPSSFIAFQSSQPWDIAVASNGTIYFGALNTSSQYTLYSVSPSAFTSTIPVSAPATQGTVANNIPSISSGLAIGASGTLYVGGTPPVSITGGVQTPVSTGLSSVSGIAIGSGGTLIIAGTGSNGELQLVTGGSAAATFGSVAVGSTSSAVPFSFTVAGGTTISSISVMTMGATGQDFAKASGSTCAAQAYSATTSCTIDITVSPVAAGLRMGGLLISSNKGSTFVPLYATGTGPQIAFTPATQSTSFSGLNLTNRTVGLAVDGSGNLYAGGSDSAVKSTLAAGTYGSISNLDTNLIISSGVAVDGGGNVYISGMNISSSPSTVVVRLPWTGSGYGTPVTLPFSGLSNDVAGVAVDGAGNVYYADVDNSRILMVPWDSGTQTYGTQSVLPFTGLSVPMAVTVDGNGNVYASNSGNGTVEKLPWNSTTKSFGTQVTVASGLGALRGLAVDANGDVYAADTQNNRVAEIPWTGTGYGAAVTVVNSLSSPMSVALDGSGNLFVLNLGTNSVIKVNVSTPPSISFPTSTAINTADATDNPQKVTLENVGNENLNFPIPGSGKNPNVTGAFSLNSATTCPELSTSSFAAATLTPGSSCVYAVNFTPTAAGTNSGSLALTDNNLNATGSKQTILLSGTGIIPQTTHFAVTAAGSAVAGASSNITITAEDASNATVPSYSGTVHFTSSDPAAVLPVDSQLTNGVGTFTITLKSAGSNTVIATDAVNSTITGTSGNVSVTAAAAALVTASGGTPQSAYVNTAFATPLTVTVTDVYGNPAAGQTVVFTAPSSGAGATLSTATSTNALGQTSVTATANGTTGSYAVTASVAGATATSFALTNQPPSNLVVTSLLDDVGNASNCTPQAVPGKGADAACSLRDALLEASSLGSANVTFDATVFASAHTIQLLNPSGSLAIPANTTITGATSGSGAGLINLVTVSGGGQAGGYPVFQVSGGVTAIANLTITNGYSIASGGGIAQSGGTLTISYSTISGNSVSYVGLSPQLCGGGISNTGGTLTIDSSTISGNSLTSTPGGSVIGGVLGGGGVCTMGGTLTVVRSTIAGNTVNASSTLLNLNAQGGGIFVSNGLLTMQDSTISNNSVSVNGNPAVASGGGVEVSGSAVLTGTIVAANTAIIGADIHGSYTDGGGNVTSATSPLAITLSSLDNYGGPTQTMIPLPGSPAICATSPSSATGTDQRGDSRTTNYAGTSCRDAGAVETNYTLSFSTQPPATVNVATNFSAGVTLYESGGLFAASSASLPLTLNATAGTLTNGGSSTVSAATSNGVAAYSTLQVSQSGTNDTLTSSLPLTVTGAATPIAASSTSSAFAVNTLSTTVAAANASATYSASAQTVTLDATVTSSGATVNAGTVTFTLLSSGVPVGAVTSGTVTNGAASAGYTMPAGTATGQYTIQVVYNSGGAFANSSDSSHELIVSKATETVNWTPAAGITYGTSLSGLLDAATTFNTQTVPGSFSYTAQAVGGAAAPVTASTVLPVGSYTLTASFTPSDTTNFQSISGSASLTVNPATLTITANDATRVYGTPNPAFNGGVAGSVNGDSFTESFSTSAVIGSNVGTYAIVPSVAGAGLSNYRQSSASGTLSITQATATISVNVSPSVTPGTPVTINARVASTTTGVPTGSVSFYDSTTLLGTATLTNGAVSFSTSSLAAGVAHQLGIVYGGDTNFFANSTVSTTTVVVPPLDFSLAITGPSSQTVIPGAAITYQATITPLYGSYAGPVSFAVSGLPPGATVNFSPSSIPANAGTQTVAVTILTASGTAMRRPAPDDRRVKAFTLALLIPLLGAGSIRMRVKSLPRLVCLVLLVMGGAAASFALSGCGSANGFLVQSPQNYTVSITATSGSMLHTATVTLNVQ